MGTVSATTPAPQPAPAVPKTNAHDSGRTHSKLKLPRPKAKVDLPRPLAKTIAPAVSDELGPAASIATKFDCGRFRWDCPDGNASKWLSGACRSTRVDTRRPLATVCETGERTDGDASRAWLCRNRLYARGFQRWMNEKTKPYSCISSEGDESVAQMNA